METQRSGTPGPRVQQAGEGVFPMLFCLTQRGVSFFFLFGGEIIYFEPISTDFVPYESWDKVTGNTLVSDQAQT